MNPKPEPERARPEPAGEEAPLITDLSLLETPQDEPALDGLAKPKRKLQPESVEDRRNRSMLIGVIAGIAIGLIARFTFGMIAPGPLFSEMSFAFLILMPISLGALSAYLAPPMPRRSYAWAWRATFTTISLFILAAAILALEVFICILMAAPLLYVGGWVGSTFMTWVLRQIDRRGIGYKTKHFALLIILTAPYFTAPLESLVAPQDSIRTVESRISIRATVATVWQNVTRVAPISRAEYGITWATLAGIPYPVEATLSYDGVGGMRGASYDDGLRFKEEVFEWNPLRSLSFTIRVDPAGKVNAPFNEIGGQFYDVLDAQYVLDPQADGTVLVRLISRQRVTTRFNGYATLWTDFFMNDIQDGILRVIKARAEKAVQLAP